MLDEPSTIGPVAFAIRAMRRPDLDAADAAIARALTGDDSASAFKPETKSFGPNREALRGLTMRGLVALFDAYEVAADVFVHGANAPRVAEGDFACARVMEATSETLSFAQTEVVAEIESRQPAYGPDRTTRLKLLVRWYAEGGEWAVVHRLTAEALAE